LISWTDSLPEIPGDPAAVRRFAHRLSGAADALDGHARDLATSVSSLVGGSWDSPAATQFAHVVGSMANGVRADAQAYRTAAGVLGAYASVLEQAQAERRSAQARLDNAKVEQGVVTVLLPPFSGLEAFNPDVAAAHAMAGDAVQAVKRAAGVAAAELEAIAGLPVHMPAAPPRPKPPEHHWYDGVVGFGKDLGGGLYQGVIGPTSLAWSLTGRALYDPGGAGQTWQALGGGLRNDVEHPDQLAKSLIDWNDWASGHPGRAIGTVLPMAVLAVATLGAGTAADGADGAATASRGWVLPEAGGGAWINGRWFTEHALERIAPDTPQVRAILERRALDRALAEGYQPGTERFQEWWNEKGPDPRGVPPSVVESEIQFPGTSGVRVITNANGDVVTVIPNR
jgi:uncharacterized protein YukE